MMGKFIYPERLNHFNTLACMARGVQSVATSEIKAILEKHPF